MPSPFFVGPCERSSMRFLLALLALSAYPADMVWTNIASTDFVVAAPVGFEGRQAVAIQPNETGTLRSIALPLSLAAPPGVFKVSLTRDADGVPGAPLETFAITDLRATKPSVYIIDSVDHPRLVEDTQYWIVVEASGPAKITWWGNSSSSRFSGGVQARQDGDAPWSVYWSPDSPGAAISVGQVSDLPNHRASFRKPQAGRRPVPQT